MKCLPATTVLLCAFDKQDRIRNWVKSPNSNCLFDREVEFLNQSMFVLLALTRYIEKQNIYLNIQHIQNQHISLPVRYETGFKPD